MKIPVIAEGFKGCISEKKKVSLRKWENVLITFWMSGGETCHNHEERRGEVAD